MLFSSVTFLFFFLPLALIGYLCIGPRGRNLFLLGASLLFYLWGEQQYVLLMLASILLNYVFGLLIDHPRQQDRTRKLLLAAAVSANLGLLIFFKYANFIVENFTNLFGSVFNPAVGLDKVHLPIGISFFTFQSLSYIIDTYRRQTVAQKNPLHLGLYISLFPQLIAGPIVRYNDIAGEIKKRAVTAEGFAAGAERFIFGLGKKVLIANPAGQMADQIFALSGQHLSSGTAWLGVLCYTLQIYFDFCGYSDMAIGLGRMFGFHFLENFNYPYISRSIREFWRRWHISLSTWFRDYLYIPLGGSRGGEKRTALNLLAVFLLCGFWHGASWNFVLWGLVYGFFLVLERGRFGTLLQGMHPLVQHGYTLFVVCNAWVLFRLEKLADAGTYFAAMYGFAEADRMVPQISTQMDSRLYGVLAAGMLLSLPLYPWLQKQRKQLTTNRPAERVAAAGAGTAKILLTTSILLYAASALAAGSYNPFIYFRF